MLATKAIEADMAVFGYARVSTDGQTLASQDAQLMTAGCAKVYAEKVSGARTDRVELAKVMKRLEAGDTLIVTRLDRLARSTRDLLNILHALAEKGAKFKSLADPWCDTTTPQGELLVTVLAGFATFERHLIKARTDDGRKRAKERGVRFGRPRKLDQHQRQEALQRLANGETLVDVARTFGVDATTIGRLSGSGPFAVSAAA
jgi:DNA invertase Pin-like site-specific DNA recombinase